MAGTGWLPNMDFKGTNKKGNDLCLSLEQHRGNDWRCRHKGLLNGVIGIVIQLDGNWESSETQKSKTYDDDYPIKAEKMLKRKAILRYKFKGEGSGDKIESMETNGRPKNSLVLFLTF